MGAAESPTLEMINRELVVLNAGSPDMNFTGLERANVPFRDHILSFVYGYFGYLSMGKFGIRWVTEKRIFVVSEIEHSEWLTKNSDVFRPVVQGKTTCVFWANLKAMGV